MSWLALTGCSAGAATEDETTGSTSQAIVGGLVDEGEAATSGVVALRIGDSTPFELCTGSLIAPNVVLTARHCVSKSANANVVCNAQGASTNGPHVTTDHALASIKVFTGANPTFAGEGAAAAKAIFHAEGDVLCNSDIAVVVLDRAIKGVTPLRIRLSGSVESNETIRTVGYGKNDRGVDTGTRFRKDGVGILAVGAGMSPSRTALGSLEFEVGNSICQGDSGGPAISETTGAIVGVVSRGGDCSQDFGHIYTQTSGFEALLDEAFAVAGGAPIDESAPASATAATRSDEPTTNTDVPAAGQGCSASSSTTTSSTGALGLLLAASLLVSRRKS